MTTFALFPVWEGKTESLFLKRIQMKILIRNIRTPITATESEVMEQACLRLAPLTLKKDITNKHIFRRSVDTRRREITFVWSVALEIPHVLSEKELSGIDAVELYESDPLDGVSSGDEIMTERPVVVGFGPCGMFCALMLAEWGYKPIVIERGDNVLSRTQKVGKFFRDGVLDTESNIQFGAGGAGTFSDGKLVTRINDSRVGYVLKRLYSFGAPHEVLLHAKPHIGTDKLLGVVNNVAARIQELGGEIRYNTRLDEIVIKNGRAAALRTQNGEIPCSTVILAIGHSARDTYYYLKSAGFRLVPKPFSVGVRIEHLREDIDRAIYGRHAGDPRLGSAEYALSKRVGEDCVYTFCMCPGGEVVAAASEEGGVVTNGMSRYKRDGVNSNAAIAVNVLPDGDPIEFQRNLERRAYELGGRDYSAPIMTVGDFLHKTSGRKPSRVTPTYRKGKVKEANLRKLFPERISSMLELGIHDFDHKIKGFSSPSAILTGVESRTSAPLRIMRNEALLAEGFDNIYPCGEGAGYAGGITSAAVDGIRVAEEIIKRYKRFE